MAKAQLKTTKNKKSVADFLNDISDAKKIQDCKELLILMKNITGKKPVMWGTSIIGFGEYHYKYASGREGDFFRVGFSPRAQNITIYIMPGYQDYSALLKDLGSHSRGKSCLYIKHLDDIHLPTLKKLISKGWKDMARLYPEN